jgi:hypothetical protein
MPQGHSHQHTATGQGRVRVIVFGRDNDESVSSGNRLFKVEDVFGYITLQILIVHWKSAISLCPDMRGTLTSRRFRIARRVQRIRGRGRR